MGRASVFATSSYYVPRTVLHALATGMNKLEMVPDNVELVGRKTKGYLSLYLFPSLPWPGRRPPQVCALVFTQESPLLSLSP